MRAHSTERTSSPNRPARVPSDRARQGAGYVGFCLLVLALSVAIWHALTSAQATASVPVFGPKKYVRTTGAPNQYEDRFDIPNSIRSPFTLHIVNGDATGGERISSATIRLNGVAVATPKDFSKQVGAIDVPITLQ